MRELLDRACTHANLQLEPRFEVSHLATAGALVAQGLGNSALPRLTLPVLASRDLVIRQIEDFGASRRIGLVWRSGRTLSPPARAFLRLVRSAPLQVPADTTLPEPGLTQILELWLISDAGFETVSLILWVRDVAEGLLRIRA